MRLILTILIITTACSSGDRWLKGNLHTHSYWSDGDEFPEMIMEWYKKHDYHFISMSDHNILAQGDFWMEVEDSLDKVVFEKYLDYYGQEWVEHEEDSITRVRLKTLAEYRPLFEEPGEFLILQAEEITDNFQGKPIHLNATNLINFIEPQGGNSLTEVLQRNINAVLQQRKVTGEPMIVHINHPNFHYVITVEDMIALQGEQFFEVFNGHPMVFNLGDSVHMDTETMWDMINIAYIKNGKPPLYGLATDDSHNYHATGKQWSNSGRGWIWVQADSLDAASLIESMEKGRFYASTGVELDKLEFNKNILSIQAKGNAKDYNIQFIGCDLGDSSTKILKEVRGGSGTFEVTSDLLFVRAKVISNQPPINPVENISNQTAWTQPVSYVD